MWKSFHRFWWDLRPFWRNMASWAEKPHGFPMCFLNTIIIIKHNSLTTSFALSLVSCSLIGLINSYFRSVRAVTLFIYGKQSLTSQLFFRWKPLPSFVDSKGETIEDRSWWVSNIDFGFKYEPKNFTLYSFFLSLSFDQSYRWLPVNFGFLSSFLESSRCFSIWNFGFV